MSLLLRKVSGNLRAWQNLLKEATREQVAKNPPLWVIREFMPNERDNGALSVYEVCDENEATMIAGAFAFQSERFEGQLAFLSTSRQAIAAAWIKTAETKGNLDHLIADTKHRELAIGTIFEAALVAGAFLSGELLSFEGKTAANAARKSARANEILFLNVCAPGSSFEKNFGGKNTLKLIGERVIETRGIPL